MFGEDKDKLYVLCHLLVLLTFMCTDQSIQLKPFLYKLLGNFVVFTKMIEFSDLFLFLFLF